MAEVALRRRVVVLGATDMGKSTFIRAAIEERAAATRLIDLDPGQKMIGPPGTATLGLLDPERLERSIFVGTTSSSAVRAIARAAAELARIAAEQGPFIVNTSGFVKGLGARLQAATVAAIKPDLVVEVGSDPFAPSIVQPSSGVPILRLTRSPAARRKSAGARARLRQAAFAKALEGAEPRGFTFDVVEPGPLAAFEGSQRPVCSVADAEGVDIVYGILLSVEGGRATVLTSASLVGARRLRLGWMWAAPKDGVWHLLDTLAPAWTRV